MPQKTTLQQLIEMARDRIDGATRALGASRSTEQQENSKLQLLVDYRREYLERFAQAARDGLDRRAWSNYQDFLMKLDTAISQQKELLGQHGRKVDACRSDWQAASRKLKSFDTLDQRRRQAERVVDERREQSAQDEFVSNRNARSRPRG